MPENENLSKWMQWVDSLQLDSNAKEQGFDEVDGGLQWIKKGLEKIKGKINPEDVHTYVDLSQQCVIEIRGGGDAASEFQSVGERLANIYSENEEVLLSYFAQKNKEKDNNLLSAIERGYRAAMQEDKEYQGLSDLEIDYLMERLTEKTNAELSNEDREWAKIELSDSRSQIALKNHIIPAVQALVSNASAKLADLMNQSSNLTGSANLQANSQPSLKEL